MPQPLGLFDQFGLWGNLGVSLLGFTGAIYVLQPAGTGTPELSLLAALTATVLGTVLGSLVLALSGVPGVQTGAPAMVLLRGLFGARVSYLPTVLNVLQLFGWSIFELVTISTAAHTVTPAVPKWGYVLIAGVLTGLLTIHPLGAIRTLRRYATVAVLIVMIYLFIQLIRHPLPSFTHGTWSGFWVATDTVVAVAISFAPLAADYTRHARSARSAFAGAVVGYSVTQVFCYVIGLLALVTVAHGNPGNIFGAFIAVPLGSVGFAILAARELDQSFADVYSTAISMQNLRPLWDRRILAGVITALTTAGALWLNIADYENFLTLLGSVFVPMSAVLIADYFAAFRGARRHWDLSPSARSRWSMLLPWAAGFVVYQLINPGYISWWAAAWTSFGADIGFTVQSWMSASILSFCAAGIITLLIRGMAELLRRLSSGKHDRISSLTIATGRTTRCPWPRAPVATDGMTNVAGTDTTQRAKILLVDDRAENLLALEAILSSLDQELVFVRSGEAAVEAAAADEFSVILLDVVMPGMDGFETAAQLKRRARTPDAPILFLTAAGAEPELAFRGYAAGAVDYISKPFDPWVLRAKVSVYVDLYLKERQLDALSDLPPLLSAIEEAVAALDGAPEALAAGTLTGTALSEGLAQLTDSVASLRAALGPLLPEKQAPGRR